MRAVGSIAISLCYVAAGRFDGMLTGRACRSVDAAAGQLVAREAGAAVAFAGDGLTSSLDLDARYHVAAALDPRAPGDGAGGAGARRAAREAAGVTRRTGFVDWGLAQRVAVGVAGDDAATGPLRPRARSTPPAPRRVAPGRATTPASTPAAAARARADRSRRVGAARACGTLRELSDGLERADRRRPERCRGRWAAWPGRWPGRRRAPRPESRSATERERCWASTTSRWPESERPAAARVRRARTWPPHTRSSARTPDLFLRWIAIHETTHAIQFASVPWLRVAPRGPARRADRRRRGPTGLGSLRALARAAAERRPAERDSASLCGRSRRACSPGPSRPRPWTALQAAMSVIEGHAEHVMDAAGERLDARLRSASRARSRRAAPAAAGLGEVIARLLGWS